MMAASLTHETNIFYALIGVFTNTKFVLMITSDNTTDGVDED